MALVNICFRLPAELHEPMKRAAGYRGMNTFLVDAVKAHLGMDEPDPHADAQRRVCLPEDPHPLPPPGSPPPEGGDPVQAGPDAKETISGFPGLD